MNQAILITAYKNIAHLQSIINYFDSNYCFYIHIDKKSKIPENEIVALRQNDRVFVSRAFKTNWAGSAHLKCILLLMDMALTNKKTEYIHLISGHDFPIKNPTYFTEFLQANKGKQFINYFKLPAKNWDNGGMDRLKYYHMYDLIDAKGKYGYLIPKILKLQKKLKIERKKVPGDLTLFGGSTWWTLSYDCCNFVSEYIAKNPQFLKRFNYTYCAEEIFFQTIILNSHFGRDVVDNNLRHIVWELRNGNIPAVLDISDFVSLRESKHLFARRFDYPVSNALMEILKLKAQDQM